MYKTLAFKQRGLANVAGFAKISAGPHAADSPLQANIPQ